MTVSFVTPSGGDWFSASNWSDNETPTIGDDVVFNIAGLNRFGPVTISGGAAFAKTVALHLDALLEIGGASGSSLTSGTVDLFDTSQLFIGGGADRRLSTLRSVDPHRSQRRRAAQWNGLQSGVRR